MNKTGLKLVSSGLAFAAISAVPSAQADYISPNIKDRGQQYTDEKPAEEYYGTGQGGRLVESFELRMQVDGLLRDHRWEEAIKKARKCVQLDPGYPENHLHLARALSGKLYDEKGPIDEKLLQDALKEWTLIRFHDSDVTSQLEARAMLSQLHRISKTLEKDKILKAKVEAQKKAAEALLQNRVTGDMDKVAGEQAASAKAGAGAPTGSSASEPTIKATSAPASENKTLDEVATQLAQKQKKRWILF